MVPPGHSARVGYRQWVLCTADFRAASSKKSQLDFWSDVLFDGAVRRSHRWGEMAIFQDRGDVLHPRPEEQPVVRSLFRNKASKPMAESASPCVGLQSMFRLRTNHRRQRHHQLGVRLGSADPRAGCGGDCDRYVIFCKPRGWRNLRLD